MNTDSTPAPGELPDPSDADFRIALQSLVDAYKPLLEEDLARTRDLDALAKESLAAGPDCEAEIAATDKLFSHFVNEKVAVALLPPVARELLGPAERWRWCLLHLRCCLVFGYLVCRRHSNFRAWAYWLYRYWLCVRQILNTPVTPGKLTEHERRDLATLVQALARAFRPQLADQLASVDYTEGLPHELESGQLDCREGEAEAAAVFERLLTEETAHALLGEATFKQHAAEPWFWFCRCWCLCAMRLGCCLARARTLPDVARCLRAYARCLRQCFRPLSCAITDPQGCVAEQVDTAIPALVVPITGTAAGLGFNRYVMEWSRDGITWHAANFLYPPLPPGNPVQGNAPVTGGLLALLNTTLLDAGSYVVRLTVFGSGSATRVCTASFSVFKRDVRILGVNSDTTLSSGWSDPAAQLVDMVPALCTRPAGVFEASFGGRCLSILGSAYIGGCEDTRRIKRYTLDYKLGYETLCSSGGWNNFWAVDYTTPAQQRAVNLRTDTSVLTAVWGEDCLVPVPFPPWCLVSDLLGRLYPSTWDSRLGACGLSGLYTLRLTVEDTLGGTYCDTQRVWLDNKTITARIVIDAVPKCADLFVSQFALPPDCTVPWKLPVSGIAFDELIDEMLPPSRPNDNFDHYVVSITKQGGPGISIPVPGPGGSCYHGTSRVGDPGVRCGAVVGPEMLGTLTVFDLRAIDPLCSAQVPYVVPAGFTTPRGECCVYTFSLTVYDRTQRGCEANWASSEWPVKICNDLRPS